MLPPSLQLRLSFSHKMSKQCLLENHYTLQFKGSIRFRMWKKLFVLNAFWKSTIWQNWGNRLKPTSDVPVYSSKPVSFHTIIRNRKCTMGRGNSVVRLLNKCYWTRSFEQNRWTKNQLNKNLLNKKSIEQVDNWTNIWLNNYPLNKCIWTKLLQQLNKSWIEQVVTFLSWLRKLRLAECVVARQRHEARGVWGACPPF